MMRDSFVKYVNTANKEAQSAYKTAQEFIAYAIQLGGYRFKQSENNPRKLIGTVPNNMKATLFINFDTGLPVASMASNWHTMTQTARRERQSSVIVGDKVHVHDQKQYQSKVLSKEVSELRASLNEISIENIDKTANWPELNELLTDAIEGKVSSVRCFPADIVHSVNKRK